MEQEQDRRRGYRRAYAAIASGLDEVKTVMENMPDVPAGDLSVRAHLLIHIKWLSDCARSSVAICRTGELACLPLLARPAIESATRLLYYIAKDYSMSDIIAKYSDEFREGCSSLDRIGATVDSRHLAEYSDDIRKSSAATKRINNDSFDEMMRTVLSRGSFNNDQRDRAKNLFGIVAQNLLHRHVHASILYIKNTKSSTAAEISIKTVHLAGAMVAAASDHFMKTKNNILDQKYGAKCDMVIDRIGRDDVA